jgi:hypothetical protein
LWREDRLLDEFDEDQLQKALHRRRPHSQLLSQPVTDQPGHTSMEMPISPTVSGFITAGHWPDTSVGLLSDCAVPPSTDMDADLAFWTSLAGWDDSELTLPSIEPGMPHRLSCCYNRHLLPYSVSSSLELRPPYQQAPNAGPLNNVRANDAYNLQMPTEVVHDL